MDLKKVSRLALFALVLCVPIVAGCSKEEPTPEVSATPPAATGAAIAPGGAKDGASASTDLSPAPAGVKTDLSGGLK